MSIYKYLNSNKAIKREWDCVESCWNLKDLLWKYIFYVAGNIALRKPAMQSSTYTVKSSDLMAAWAVDGETDSWYCRYYYSSTVWSYKPWWAVDLQARYTVLNISLTYTNWKSTSMCFIHSQLIYWNVVFTWVFFITLCHKQSNVVISRSNLSRYYIRHCDDSDWDFRITKGTPYLALTGKLWSVCLEDFEENWPRYNGTALYTILDTCVGYIHHIYDTWYLRRIHLS